MSIDTTPGAVARAKPPTAWIAAGVLAAVAAAAAATVALRSTPEAVPAAVSSAATSPGTEALKPAPGQAIIVPPPSVQAQAERPVARPAKPKVAAAVCGTCGVVESVVAVKRKGEGTGLGAVAGGVLGAVVGNQMGSGNGRKAMTVIGAVGGGVAGHEVEKRARADTVYKVRVRMDDNSERTVEQAEPAQVGARVEVHGGSLKAVRTSG